MSEPEYICLSCGRTLDEDELWPCHNSDCDGQMCPGCGGEISTIEEYDKAMKERARES